MPQSDVRQVDVTLVGGGMSGAVLALSLAALRKPDGSPLDILLLEASAPEAQPSATPAHPGFDARAIALSAGTCEALERRGLWPLFEPHCAPLPRSMSRIAATAVRPVSRRRSMGCLRSVR